MEKKFVQHCETKVVANACNASYMITKMAKMPIYIFIPLQCFLKYNGDCRKCILKMSTNEGEGRGSR